MCSNIVWVNIHATACRSIAHAIDAKTPCEDSTKRTKGSTRVNSEPLYVRDLSLHGLLCSQFQADPSGKTDLDPRFPISKLSKQALQG